MFNTMFNHNAKIMMYIIVFLTYIFPRNAFYIFLGIPFRAWNRSVGQDMQISDKDS